MSTQVAQVGGNHYAAEYQHWDWSEEVGLGNMEYAATKYLTRWRRKEGLQDLKKAQSYVQKLVELHNNKSRLNPAVFIPRAFERFCSLNDVSGRERDVCLLLTTWRREEDLGAVLVILQDIIFDNFPESFASKLTEVAPLMQLTYDPNEGEEYAVTIESRS